MSQKTKAIEEKDYAREQAKAQLESIIEMVQAVYDADNANDDNAAEEARETIQNDPLSVEVRSAWGTPGEEMKPAEFNILLCTGGPAVRIMGELDKYSQPDRAWIQYQDWGTPWTDYVPSMANEANESLLAYCHQFYFGE